jgi:hypothetical protein
VLVPEREVIGPEETVFHWSEDVYEPENIPDIARRAFRDADGRVQLTAQPGQLLLNSRSQPMAPGEDHQITDARCSAKCSSASSSTDLSTHPGTGREALVKWHGMGYS